MANVNTRVHVFMRDGFVCRYCGERLYLAQAIKVLDAHVSDLNLWDRHGRVEPLRTRWATVDHVKSEVEGGMDVLENLVACCVSCNSSKGSGHGRKLRDISADGKWDGLSRIFVGLASSYQEALTTEDVQWLKVLQREGVTPNLAHLEDAIESLRVLKNTCG